MKPKQPKSEPLINYDDHMEEIVNIVFQIIGDPPPEFNWMNILSLKEEMTPDNELLDLYRAELKTVQNKLLNYRSEFQDTIRYQTLLFRMNFDACMRKEGSYPPNSLDEIVQFQKQMIKAFIDCYTSNNGNSLLSDLLKFDVDHYSDLHEFPQIIELIDPILTMDNLDQLFFEYHKKRKKSKKNNQFKHNELLGFHNRTEAQLKTEHRRILFDSLIEGRFIPDTTDNNCFNWIFGEPSNLNLDTWEPIMWNEAKQGLRELLTPILGTIRNQNIREINYVFCDKTGNPFEMSKPKTGEHSARCTDIEKILKSLNLEKKPTSPDHL